MTFIFANTRSWPLDNCDHSDGDGDDDEDNDDIVTHSLIAFLHSYCVHRTIRKQFCCALIFVLIH